MILLDTNVVSELMKVDLDPRVKAWMGRRPMTGFFITVITEAELRFGVELLPSGRRRDALASAMESLFSEEFADRILPFDSSAAIAYASIAVERRRIGKPITQFDAQIAAIAHSRGSALATRDTADFVGCGIEVVNPWDAESPD